MKKAILRTIGIGASLILVVTVYQKWMHVMDLQHHVNHGTFLSQDLIDAEFAKCRGAEYTPVVVPEQTWTGITDNVEAVRCVKWNKYFEFEVVNVNDGRAYDNQNHDDILKLLRNHEKWQESHRKLFMTTELKPKVSEYAEKYWAEFDQQAIDEMKVKAGEMEASAGM